MRRLGNSNGTALGLSLLVTLGPAAPAARAWGGIFGFGGPGAFADHEPAVPTTQETLGFAPVDDMREFPAFQNFRVTSGPAQGQVVAAGMVHRTHRHWIARSQRTAGLLGSKTGLQVSRPLGSYAEGMERGMLMEVVLKDAQRMQVAEVYEHRRERGDDDFRDVLRRRLEAAQVSGQGRDVNQRNLTFALESTSGRRRRHLFLYRAERQAMADGEWWVCDFYDPHEPVGSKVRLARLRVRAGNGEDLDAQLSSAWVRAVDAGGADPFSIEPDPYGEWAPLGFGNQLKVVDDGGIPWNKDLYRPVDAATEADEAQDLLLRRARPLGASRRPTLEAWVGGDFEEGLFDGVGQDG